MSSVAECPERQATTEPQNLGDLRTLISTALIQLSGLHDDLAALVGERHTTGPGFLSAEGKRMQSELHRKEKRAQWDNRELALKLTGPIPAPANVAAVNLMDEIERFVWDLVTEVRGRLRRAQVCLVGEPLHLAFYEGEYGTGDLLELTGYANYLLSGYTRAGYLRNVHRDAEELAGRARRYLLGEQVMAHDEPCPWCGHRSLTVNQTTGVIECGEDRDTGRRHPCVCDDSYCPCKASPTGHHHRWHRSAADVRRGGGDPDITHFKQRRHSESWYGLRDLLDARATTEKES